MVFSLAALPLAPFDNRLVWPLTLIMIISVSLECVLVGLIVFGLCYRILQGIMRKVAKNKEEKKNAVVVPTLSEISDSRNKNGSKNQGEGGLDKEQRSSKQYQVQAEEQRKLNLSTFHEVVTQLAAAKLDKITEFISNLTIYDARLVHKFIRLVQTEFSVQVDNRNVRKSDQRLPYKSAMESLS